MSSAGQRGIARTDEPLPRILLAESGIAGTENQRAGVEGARQEVGSAQVRVRNRSVATVPPQNQSREVRNVRIDHTMRRDVDEAIAREILGQDRRGSPRRSGRSNTRTALRAKM